jgi:N-acetylglutamate synthase-like GNAT family acetyltransferase
MLSLAKFREMTPKDVEAVAAMVRQTYDNEKLWPMWDQERIKNDIKHLSATKVKNILKTKGFIATISHEIIGFAGVANSLISSNTFELYWGTVKPEYQHRGVGTKLIEMRLEYIKHLSAHGFAFVYARYPKLFEKFGFIPIVVDDEDQNLPMTYCYLKF